MRSFTSRVLLIRYRRAAGERRNDEIDCGQVVEAGIMAIGGFVCLRENLAHDVMLACRSRDVLACQ